jgi:hypothetical protein
VTLIEIIEALKGAAPSFKIDQAIARLDWYREEHGDCADNEVPPFTESLDAAVMLVPPDHWWSAGNCKREDHASVGPDEHLAEENVCEGFGTTVAIALCIAALSSRALAQS